MLRIGSVATPYDHPIFEQLPLSHQACGKVRDGEPVRADKLAKLVLPHHGVPSEAQVVMSVELTGQSALDHAENAEDRECRDGPKNSGHPKTDADENTDRGCHPD